MNGIFDKKTFCKMMLRDRLPVACAEFPIGKEQGSVEFYHTPLGVVLITRLGMDNRLLEIKLYDRKRGDFTFRNVFCGESPIEIESGVFFGLSSKLQIEDIIGRDFLIKAQGLNIIARATLLPKKTRKVAFEPIFG